MKLHLSPKEPAWWAWIITIVFLAVGLAGVPVGFTAAILFSAAQTVVFAVCEPSLSSYPVQIRAAYTAFLIIYQIPFLNALFWVPAIGTLAFVLFGYCLMARLLSLCPWNRSEPLTFNLLKRTFFTAPIPGNSRHGLPGNACLLEARAAFFSPTKTQN